MQAANDRDPVLPGDPLVRAAFNEAIDRLEDPESVLVSPVLAERRLKGTLKVNTLTVVIESDQDRNLLTKTDDYDDIRMRIGLAGGLSEKSTALMNKLSAENEALRKENNQLRCFNAELVAERLASARTGARGALRTERKAQNEAAGYTVPDYDEDDYDGDDSAYDDVIAAE